MRSNVVPDCPDHHITQGHIRFVCNGLEDEVREAFPSLHDGLERITRGKGVTPNRIAFLSLAFW